VPTSLAAPGQVSAFFFLPSSAQLSFDLFKSICLVGDCFCGSAPPLFYHPIPNHFPPHGCQLRLPPLRCRPDDVSLSFCSFVVSSLMPPPAASPLLLTQHRRCSDIVSCGHEYIVSCGSPYPMSASDPFFRRPTLFSILSDAKHTCPRFHPHPRGLGHIFVCGLKLFFPDISPPLLPSVFFYLAYLHLVKQAQ